jgi:hypothetical protein
MKVLAFKSSEEMIVSMSVAELINLAGFNYRSDFNKALGADIGSCDECCRQEQRDSLINLENIAVGDIYNDARATLNAYEELRTKFESIRNQLTTMMGKMVKARPIKEKK